MNVVFRYGSLEQRNTALTLAHAQTIHLLSEKCSRGKQKTICEIQIGKPKWPSTSRRDGEGLWGKREEKKRKNIRKQLAN